MAERIMMQVSGANRPLSFGESGLPSVASADLAWGGVPTEIHRLGAWEGEGEFGPKRGERGMMVFLSGQVEFLTRLKGRDVTHRVGAGSATLMSGSECVPVLRCRGQAEVAVMDWPDAWVLRASGRVALDCTLSLGPNAVLHGLAVQMADELRRGATTGALFAESLSLAMLSYAMQQLPPAPHPERSTRTLAPRLQQTLRDYILANLQENLSISDLAACVGLGPRRFSTLFTTAFGQTPYQYVLEQRVTEGARLLRTRRTSMAEVALAVGFSSQSHFSTTFLRRFGVSPSRYLTELGLRPATR